MSLGVARCGVLSPSNNAYDMHICLKSEIFCDFCNTNIYCLTRKFLKLVLKCLQNKTKK